MENKPMKSPRTLVLLAFLSSLGSGEEPTNSSTGGLPADPAVQKLDGVTARMAAWLRETPTFRVEATSNWTLAGEQPRKGVARCKLGKFQPDCFQLDVASDIGQKALLKCASDGKNLTRLYRCGPLAIVSRHAGGLAEVLSDALTEGCLKGTGLNVILRPDVHAYLMASASEVKDCGREEVQGKPADHFSATWFGGSRVDFWIAAGDSPVMLRWKRVIKMGLGEQSRELLMDSNLIWDLNPKFAEAETAIQLPPDAVQVEDLQAYLVKGGTEMLLGQRAPNVALKLLDGSDWDLAKHRDKHIVVLLFFATWAMPSTQDIPAILAFVNEYAERGVVVYAVNVGEASDTVRAFTEGLKYSHPVVLDPEQRAASAYRVTSLPVTVLVGKDGTLRAVHVGTSLEERAMIRRDLQQLVDGASPAPAKM
jgi:peroxiredoxin